MIKSPLRYPGGKSRAAEKIAALASPFLEYREPFLGGGSVFFQLKQQFPSRKYWVNDLYFELYTFWNQSKENVYKVVAQIEIWRAEFPVGKDLHQFLMQNMQRFDDLERASAFFIFNRITFSGTTEAGGFSEQAFQGRFTDSSIQRLKNLENILGGVQITNFDYQEVIETAGKDVFLFLDPPYFSATKSALYGKKGALHKGFDHERFAQVLKKTPHKWLMTYDDSDYIRNLFSDSHIVAWDLTYGMRNVNENGNQIGKELFISNYPLPTTEKKQLDLFQVS
jgi:DNA adenine methylase